MMKRYILAGMVGLAAAVSAGAGEGSDGARRIALVNVGGFHEPTLGRVAGYLATNLKTSPRILADQKVTHPDDLEAQAKALAPLVKDDVLCVIGIAVMPEGLAEHGAISPGDKTAVLNATALKPAEGTDEEYGQRLEKEALRCAGLLLGMEPCPTLYCALHPYADDKGLDAKGRNFCPPCQFKFQTHRAEANLQVRKEDGTP